MAEISPFQAWRYDPARCPLASVVTQPYDKITPEMQERYYWSSPFNLVRIVLGKAEPGDHDGNNVYTRAAEHFHDWRSKGVLVQDPEPSIYGYAQRFAVPGNGHTVERRGIIGLGRIHDYSENIVFRHEQTLAKPKADRLQLLRATRAQFEQLFMLYDDPQQEIEGLLPWDQAAIAEVTDDYGVVNRLWQFSEPALINRVTAAFSRQKLIIADGHHRYETALSYRDEQAKASTVGQNSNYVVMTCVNLHSPGLIILPTHRVIHNLAGFDADRFAQRAAEFLEVEPLPAGQSAAALLDRLRSAASNSILAITRKRDYLLRATPEKLNALLASFSERQRSLDVILLHKVLIERVLGLSEHAVREQRHIAYLRDAEPAVKHVRSREAEVAFLMNPVTIQQMRDVALAGELMPQKSTDFYPKLLSGLTIYALD
ncbi:MAG: DUF1015 domain-containing protein [Acidobacteriales bacterium]|nr:DUF1015 domain-containing protein [Terriglobales bacterium]